VIVTLVDLNTILVEDRSLVDVDLIRVICSFLVIIVRHQINVLSHCKKNKREDPDKEDCKEYDQTISPVQLHFYFLFFNYFFLVLHLGGSASCRIMIANGLQIR
jgi:hypothetical protein